MKTVYSFDYFTGLYLGPVTLTESDVSPLEPDVYLIPGNCTETEPPSPQFGQQVVYANNQWEIIPVTTNETEPSYVQTKEETIAVFTRAVQMRLDEFAQARGYENMGTLATYVNDPFPQFDAEGRKGRDLRSATWVAAHTIFNRIIKGEAPFPESVEEFESELPTLVWE